MPACRGALVLPDSRVEDQPYCRNLPRSRKVQGSHELTPIRPRPGIFAELESRGLVHSKTHKDLESILDREQMTLYCGFDPTAPSLQVGNLVPLLTLARFQRYRHRPIVVLGGGTGMIGDPSGKSDERNLLDQTTLSENAAAQRRQFEAILDFEDEVAPALMVDNLDWLAPLDLIGFLRDVGKHFPVSVMLSRESVNRRLGSDAGISFTEFSYQAIQAYDFLHLYRAYDCRLQIGGSDQLGNIVAGTDLIRRSLGPEDRAFGLVFPLLQTRSGQKMGKTAAGTIWLDAERTPVLDFYQYWYNFADEDVLAALKVFTFCDHVQIADAESQLRAEPAARRAQRLLADSVTALVHGAEAAAAARAEQAAMFGRGAAAGAASTPHLLVDSDDLEAGLDLRQLLVDCGLAPSRSQARRLIAQGAIRINGLKRGNEPLKPSDLDADGLILLAAGPRNRRLIGVRGTDQS